MLNDLSEWDWPPCWCQWSVRFTLDYRQAILQVRVHNWKKNPVPYETFRAVSDATRKTRSSSIADCQDCLLPCGKPASQGRLLILALRVPSGWTRRRNRQEPNAVPPLPNHKKRLMKLHLILRLVNTRLP